MKRLLALLALAASAAAASPVTDYFVELTKDEGPSVVVEVDADTPTPLMTGYHAKTRQCDLLVNRARWKPGDSVMWLVMVVHEAGHCKALRAGVTDLDHPSINDERIADTFAVAWIYQNLPADADSIVDQLLDMRRSDRLTNRMYDTLFAIVRTRALIKQYPGADPWAFTIKQFQQ